MTRPRACYATEAKTVTRKTATFTRVRSSALFGGTPMEMMFLVHDDIASGYSWKLATANRTGERLVRDELYSDAVPYLSWMALRTLTVPFPSEKKPARDGVRNEDRECTEYGCPRMRGAEPKWRNKCNQSPIRQPPANPSCCSSNRIRPQWRWRESRTS